MIVAGALALSACGRGGEQGAGAPNGDILANALVPPEDRPAEQAAPTAAWIGRWTGPEGLFLDVAQGPAAHQYALTIKADLDSEGDRFEGRADGDAIRFTRAGEDLAIRHGSGADTGFKWLADKKDCLIVAPDKEGYCRD